MILYRIARDTHALDLSGKGGLISSARWHEHLSVIYTSLSSSTAVLEKLVHLQPTEIHNDLKMITMEITEDVSSERIEASQLPDGWTNYPSLEYLKQIGNAWLTGKTALLLYVPSAIDPIAENVLINPAHEQIQFLKTITIQDFRFDQRLVSVRS
jgi:RES domain-containing protein